MWGRARFYLISGRRDWVGSYCRSKPQSSAAANFPCFHPPKKLPVVIIQFFDPNHNIRKAYYTSLPASSKCKRMKGESGMHNTDHRPPLHLDLGGKKEGKKIPWPDTCCCSCWSRLWMGFKLVDRGWVKMAKMFFCPFLKQSILLW